jgi:hypothetical protein
MVPRLDLDVPFTARLIVPEHDASSQTSVLLMPCTDAVASILSNTYFAIFGMLEVYEATPSISLASSHSKGMLICQVAKRFVRGAQEAKTKFKPFG